MTPEEERNQKKNNILSFSNNELKPDLKHWFRKYNHFKEVHMKKHFDNFI